MAEVSDQLLDRALEARLIKIRVADTMRRAQSGNDPRHVNSHTEGADPVAPIGSRAAGAEGGGGLSLLMTCAILARHVADVGRALTHR
jgi:hypothetical protein